MPAIYGNHDEDRDYRSEQSERDYRDSRQHETYPLNQKESAEKNHTGETQTYREGNYSQRSRNETEKEDNMRNTSGNSELENEPEEINDNYHSKDEASESSITVWDLFERKLKDKSYYLKQKDYPRKPMMIDPDLCSTLREIDIENVSPTNVLNTIVRSFIEIYKEELRTYRKIQAPSVF